MEDPSSIRCVEPYVFTYVMHAKQRWFGRTVSDVFHSEYKAHPPSYYAAALVDGRIRVNGSERGVAEHVLKNGDRIEHLAHRHEPPVSIEGLRVVDEDENVVAVFKPSSLPMHPCGSYHLNTLSSILRDDYGYADLRQVHRLDKLTSGLVLLAKSSKAAKELCDAIGSGKTRKTYVARVLGSFPSNAPLDLLHLGEEPPIKRHKSDLSEEVSGARSMESTWRKIDENWIEVNVALECLSHKDGTYKCGKDGRPSRTLFRKVLELEDGTSLVECRPRTGRTHQIRLHLQWLGHPIANDPCYGGKLFTENGDVDHQKEEDEVLSRRDVPVERLPDEDDDSFVRRACPRCRLPTKTQQHPTCIWLHALQYAYPKKWSYHTPLPRWASAANLDDILTE